MAAGDGLRSRDTRAFCCAPISPSDGYPGCRLLEAKLGGAAHASGSRLLSQLFFFFFSSSFFLFFLTRMSPHLADEVGMAAVHGGLPEAGAEARAVPQIGAAGGCPVGRDGCQPADRSWSAWRTACDVANGPRSSQYLPQLVAKPFRACILFPLSVTASNYPYRCHRDRSCVPATPMGGGSSPGWSLLSSCGPPHRRFAWKCANCSDCRRPGPARTARSAAGRRHAGGVMRPPARRRGPRAARVLRERELARAARV